MYNCKVKNDFLNLKNKIIKALDLYKVHSRHIILICKIVIFGLNIVNIRRKFIKLQYGCSETFMCTSNSNAEKKDGYLALIIIIIFFYLKN